MKTINIVNKRLPYPDLEDAYKRGLEKIRSGQAKLNINYGKNNSKRDNTVFHVSDLGYAYDLCDRQLWLKLNQADKKELHYGQKMLFMHGDIIHIATPQILELGLRDYWTIIEIEKPVNEGLPDGIVGRTDMILLGANGERIIVDFKTSRGKNFDYLDRDGVKEEPQAQVRGYIFAEHADYGILFYVDREGQNGVRQFLVQPDSEQFLNDLYTIKQKTKYEPSILPPKIRTRENKGDNSIYIDMPWQCKYCNYLDVSCPGALPPEKRDINGVVAKEKDNGEIYPYKEKYKNLIEDIKKAKEGNND